MLVLTGILATLVCQNVGQVPETVGDNTGNPSYLQCETWYQNLSDQLSDLSTAISSLNGRVDTLQAEHAALTSLINTGSGASATTLAQILDGQTAILGDIQTRFTALQTFVTNEIGQLKTEHADITTSINGGFQTTSASLANLAADQDSLSNEIEGYFNTHATSLTDHQSSTAEGLDSLETLVVTKTDGLVALFDTRFQGLLDECAVVPTTSNGEFADCTTLFNNGQNVTGVYTIYPNGYPKGVNVLCDMETDGGGWLVIQQRSTGDVDFYLTYAEYEDGFDVVTPQSDFWVGNKYIHAISQQGVYELRVDLTGDAASGFEKRAAIYQGFKLGSAVEFYALTIGAYSYDSSIGADPGDSLTYHNGRKFTTKDSDNDLDASNCAVQYMGAWWYKSCHGSNLNGDWGSTEYAKGPIWKTFLGFNRPMSYTKMMIRRTDI